MRVLYLTNNAGRASTTVGTKGWVRYLAPRGLQAVIASPILGEFSDWAKTLGVPSYQVSFPTFNRWWPVPFLRALWRMRGIVKRHGVELIHCNEQEIYPIVGALARLVGLPVVTTVHFTMDPPFCRWAFSGNRAPDRLFFVSRRSLDECRPALAGVVPEGRFTVIHNGLEMDGYGPDEGMRAAFREQHGRGRRLLVGVACALRPRKQLEHLFEAFARVESPDVGLIVAGFAVPGEEQYVEDLMREGQRRLGDRMSYIGPLTDLRPFSNGLDLFINTSQEESFGIAALEALACGCPVLGYDSKAVDEVVLPDGGEITPQDDVGELARRMEAWLSDPAKLHEARAAARRQAERFDLRAISDRVWGEYQAVLGRRGGA